MKRQNFSDAVKRSLQAASFNKCMICRTLTNKPEAAHIIPASIKGPRSEFRKDYDEAFITSVNNALNLCRKCHTEIDDSSISKYSLEELFEINKKYFLNNKIGEEYLNFFYPSEKESIKELDEFYQNLLLALNMPDADIVALLEKNSDFEKIEIDKKLSKNNFSRYIERDIRNMYVSDAIIVKEELRENPIIAKKLNCAIGILYLRCEEITGDSTDTYSKMLEIMSMHNPVDYRLDNRIILNYFFIICEVFKK